MGSSLLRWMSRLTGAAVALVLVLFLWFSINHYSGMARMNEELVEQRERAMPAKLKDGTVLREAWKGKYSWTDFCQSAVISVSPETATLFKAEIEKTSVKGAEDGSWKLTPGGHLPRCFGKEDLAALALLMKRTGYLYTTSGARTDYEFSSNRWVAHFYLLDHESGAFYQATQTSPVPG